MISLLVLFLCLFHWISYELFLWFHQDLAFVMTYTLWRHILSDLKMSYAYLLSSDSTLLITFMMKCFTVLYWNFSIHNDCFRALIVKQNDAVRMTIFCSQSWKVKTEQHLNVWISFISLWLSVQSHPFIIVSWSEGEKLSLEFLIELRDSFTQKLFNHISEYWKENISVQVMKEDSDSQSKADNMNKRLFDDVRDSHSSLKHSDLCMTFFSESHCSGILIDDYRKVLMIITEFEIEAQLLFLKELIQEFN